MKKLVESATACGRDVRVVTYHDGKTPVWERLLFHEPDMARECARVLDAATFPASEVDELERLRAENERLTRLVRMDRPWSIISVLERLADAADHLLNDHNCDTHGWEGIGLARDAAREIVRSLVDAEKAGGE